MIEQNRTGTGGSGRTKEAEKEEYVCCFGECKTVLLGLRGLFFELKIQQFIEACFFVTILNISVVALT